MEWRYLRNGIDNKNVKINEILLPEPDRAAQWAQGHPSPTEHAYSGINVPPVAVSNVPVAAE